MRDLFEEYDNYSADVRTSVPENAASIRKRAARSGLQARVKVEPTDVDLGEALVEGAKAVPLSMASGAVEGFVGLPGDLESILRGLIAMSQTPEGQDKTKELLKGFEENTVAPTSEDVAQWINQNIIDLGENAMRTIGQFLAPAGYVKPAKAVLKGKAKGLAAKVATEEINNDQ